MFQGISSRSLIVRMRVMKNRIVATRMMALLLIGSKTGTNDRRLITAIVDEDDRQRQDLRSAHRPQPLVERSRPFPEPGDRLSFGLEHDHAEHPEQDHHGDSRRGTCSR